MSHWDQLNKLYRFVNLTLELENCTILWALKPDLVNSTGLWALKSDLSNSARSWVLDSAVASLTVPGGQDFHFPYSSSNFGHFFVFFLKLFSFSSSFWSSGWATRPPGKALVTPLVLEQYPWNSKGFWAHKTDLGSSTRSLTLQTFLLSRILCHKWLLLLTDLFTWLK